MKNLVHCFSREIVSEFIDTRLKDKSSKNFEYFASIMMQRFCELQWQVPVMIGFYMNNRYHELLRHADKVSSKDLWMDALEHGIEDNSPIDFVIASADNVYGEEFQLKRFGLGNTPETTEALIEFLKSMAQKYTKVDAACLVAVVRPELIDFPKVRAEMKNQRFQFTALYIIAVVRDREFLIVSILPTEGWNVFPMSIILAD